MLYVDVETVIVVCHVHFVTLSAQQLSTHWHLGQISPCMGSHELSSLPLLLNTHLV